MHVCVRYSGMREPQVLRDYASGREAVDAASRGDKLHTRLSDEQDTQ